ncbi:hypothetical protein KP2612_002165 [Komagataella phaffii]
MLASDLKTPCMTDTSMSPDLLQSFNIITVFGLQTVGKSVIVLTINSVSLSVEEPGRNLILSWVLHNGDDPLQFFLSQLTSTLVQINISFLTNQVRVSTTHTTNGGQSVHDLDSTINIGVQQTQNMLETISLLNN